MKNDLFEELLFKEMTRREFLTHLGIVVFALSGVAGVLKILSDPHLTTTRNRVPQGFGSGPYGGVRKG